MLSDVPLTLDLVLFVSSEQEIWLQCGVGQSTHSEFHIAIRTTGGDQAFVLGQFEATTG